MRVKHQAIRYAHALTALESCARLLCMAQATGLRAEWGAKIRAARQERGLTVSKLARLADVDQGNLSRVERGVQGVSDDMRMRIAAALGVEVSELFAYPPISEAS